jgi:peroxiredoxin (alkyl hydroperoxide reductase subunit C)
MSLVGKKAPSFNAPAVINGEEIVDAFSLDQYIGKKEVILFFYPKDFTYVCPTEIHAFQESLAKFEEKGVAVVGVSTDTPEVHLAWLMTPKNKGGIEGVTYPLVADVTKTVAYNFGVLWGDWNYNEESELTYEGDGVAFRGTFFIDKEGIVRHENINDLPLGRNIDESLRIVDAWHHNLKFGEVCPANWEEGKDAMAENREGVADYLATH